jgi:hypothetical protein
MLESLDSTDNSGAPCTIKNRVDLCIAFLSGVHKLELIFWGELVSVQFYIKHTFELDH